MFGADVSEDYASMLKLKLLRSAPYVQEPCIGTNLFMAVGLTTTYCADGAFCGVQPHIHNFVERKSFFPFARSTAKYFGHTFMKLAMSQLMQKREKEDISLQTKGAPPVDIQKSGY
ncbi:hypothetical protein HAX54_038977 [Datura stramonium]|uniref:Uncharacterized protein n=1 Tax=Datura stramonium TaxID=4076 RepID=A0ABS8SIN0_DATST|nr:hypothetical protein [Datura stramonium]